jgi:peptidoglycan/xylan/chitin deacetylase (PgdA/CDA1 family)
VNPIGTAVKAGIKSASALVDVFLPPLAGPRLLIYHQVDAGCGLEMEVTGPAFARQMRWLASTGAVLAFDDALAAAAAGDTTPGYVLTFDDGYADMVINGFPLLVELGLPFVLYLTTGPLETGRPLRDDGRSLPCTWDQVETMMASGLVTVGAHTHTHPDLRTIGADRIEDEIGRSNQIIAARTGAAPRHFAYPWGYWSETADDVVRAAYASATLGGRAGIVGAPDHLLPRLPVQRSDAFPFFRARMRGGFRLEDAVRRRLSGYRGP